MLSLRLEILGSLAREVLVLEKVEQLGGLDATALEKSAGLGNLMAVVQLVMMERALEALWGPEAMILLVQKKGLESKGGVWRREVLERGNFGLPCLHGNDIWGKSPLQKVKACTQGKRVERVGGKREMDSG